MSRGIPPASSGWLRAVCGVRGLRQERRRMRERKRERKRGRRRGGGVQLLVLLVDAVDGGDGDGHEDDVGVDGAGGPDDLAGVTFAADYHEHLAAAFCGPLHGFDGAVAFDAEGLEAGGDLVVVLGEDEGLDGLLRAGQEHVR